jgi:hypothetical protein
MKYIFILLALACMACEKTIIVGGTVTDMVSGDSIEGIEMGLYRFKPEFNFDDKKWSDMELLLTTTSNSDGSFAFEIDKDLDISHNILYYPLPPADTLSVNAQYSTWGGGIFQVRYGTNHCFKLSRSSAVQFNLLNVTQSNISMISSGKFNASFSVISSSYFSIVKLLSGQEYQFDFYEVINNTETQESQKEYIGSTNRYIKTQLPVDSDKVEWLMPWQIIEIDLNTLEK